MKNLKSTSKQLKDQRIMKHEPFKKYYDSEGVEHEQEPQKCCAKHVFTENGTNMYYIKMNMSEEVYHPTKNKLYKPIHLRELGQAYWNLKKVKETSFMAYISFLKTKNELFYGNVNRSFI